MSFDTVEVRSSSLLVPTIYLSSVHGLFSCQRLHQYARVRLLRYRSGIPSRQSDADEPIRSATLTLLLPAFLGASLSDSIAFFFR
jgi:hypothetical protein